MKTSGRNIELSVLMAVRNEANHIAENLRSLINQDFDKASYEILIADGMSTDGTRRIVRTLMDENRHIYIRMFDNRRLVQYAGINDLIRLARGNYVLTLDGHASFPHDFLTKNVEAIKKGVGDIVGGIWETRGARTFWGGAIAASLGLYFGVGNSPFRVAKKRGNVMCVPFACIKREVFERIGLFKTNHLSNADIEFFHRARKNGFRIFSDPSIVSTYYSRDNLLDLTKQMFRNSKWFPAHLESVKARHLVPSAALGILLVCIVGGMWFRDLWLFLSILVSVYVILAILFSFACHRSDLTFGDRIKMLVVFPSMHASYATGIFAGLFSKAVWVARKHNDLPTLGRGMSLSTQNTPNLLNTTNLDLDIP